jgi:DNA-binding IclR family transcriptional regulator
MQVLAAAIGQSCHLVVVQAGEGMVIAREENPGVRGFALRVGASIDLVRSCSGHVLLAFSPEEATERMFSRAAALRKEPIGQSVLAARLQQVRDQGFGLRESPVTRGVTDISCPIFGFDGELLAALTVPFLELIDGSQLVSIDDACAELRQTAQRISTALGWHPPRAADAV